MLSTVAVPFFLRALCPAKTCVNFGILCGNEKVAGEEKSSERLTATTSFWLHFLGHLHFAVQLPSKHIFLSSKIVDS